MHSALTSLLVLGSILSAFSAVSADSQLPIPGLPLKTHVYADSSCAESKANLYYLPPGFCIGPLFHPANSVRVLESVPQGCNLTAYTDGRCKGSEIDISEALGANGHKRRGKKRKVIAGPTATKQCFGMGATVGRREERTVRDGANSVFLRC